MRSCSVVIAFKHSLPRGNVEDFCVLKEMLFACDHTRLDHRVDTLLRAFIVRLFKAIDEETGKKAGQQF